MQRIIMYHVKCSSRYLGGFAIVRVPDVYHLRNKLNNKRLRKARKDYLHFIRSFSESQRSLTAALVDSLALIPPCGITESYLKACHDEFYRKWQDDVVFRILVEERQEELKNFMSQHGSRRRSKKVNSFNKELVLFVD